MRLLELLAVLLAQRHDRTHVHFVEGGQDGIGRLRLQQTLGDARAQARHRHALLGAVAERASTPVAGVGSDTAGSSRRGDRTGAAPLPSAGRRAASSLVTRPPRPYRRRRRQRRLSRRESCARPAWPCQPALRPPVRQRQPARQPRPWRASAAGDGGTGLGFGVDTGDQLARDDRLAVGLDNFNQHAAQRAPAVRGRPCRSRCRSGSRRAQRPRRSSCARRPACASATDSESCGTLTSMIIVLSDSAVVISTRSRPARTRSVPFVAALCLAVIADRRRRRRRTRHQQQTAACC